MYFSLIAPREELVRHAAYEGPAGPYAEHQWLWRFFPAESGTQRDFLFRRRDIEGLPRFYVVSQRIPRPPGEAWQVQTKAYAPTVAAGQQLQFELRANPVVTRSDNGKGVRHDVVMQAKKRLLAEQGLTRWSDWKAPNKPALYQLVAEAGSAWLKARGERLGFRVEETSLIVEGYQQHAGRDNLRFSTVDFSGQLTVTDPERFGHALRRGIGRAKAFGCGLLLVRPAS